MWEFAIFIIAVVSGMSQPKTEPPNLMQEGEISLNDSEITLLINSTYEIIEGFGGNSTELEELIDLSEELFPEVEERAATRLKPKSRPAECKKYTTQEKYAMLESVGARNQLLMADSPEEASRGFVYNYPTDKRFAADAVPGVCHKNDIHGWFQTFDPNFCSPQCELIKQTLAEDERNNVTEPQNDAVVMAFGDNCFLEKFSPVGGCTDLGDEAKFGYEHLCSECRGIYYISKHCFPKFYNAVKCNNKERGCIFTTFSDTAHGECEMETLPIQVLRNRGNDTCEEWVIENLHLPVACQCMLSKASFLRATPPKEL